MICLGIDFGWQSQPSGLAALRFHEGSLELIDLARLEPPDEVLAWVERLAGSEPAIVGVDAPLVIPNATGMRPVDRQMHSCYGRFHAGCYPANLSRPFAPRVTELSAALERSGFLHAASIRPRAKGRFQIEVHPHAAAVQLFALDRILKYKKGPVRERRQVLAHYRSLLESLATGAPSLNAMLPAIPPPGHALKAVEDQLDAVLAAYIAAHWWFWGTERNESHGTADGGYIVVPHRRDPLR